ncbi:hypothetical protein AB1N83_003641 [Pleurotus pulmonarius]
MGVRSEWTVHDKASTPRPPTDRTQLNPNLSFKRQHDTVFNLYHATYVKRCTAYPPRVARDCSLFRRCRHRCERAWMCSNGRPAPQVSSAPSLHPNPTNDENGPVVPATPTAFAPTSTPAAQTKPAHRTIWRNENEKGKTKNKNN